MRHYHKAILSFCKHLLSFLIFNWTIKSQPSIMCPWRFTNNRWRFICWSLSMLNMPRWLLSIAIHRCSFWGIYHSFYIKHPKIFNECLIKLHNRQLFKLSDGTLNSFYCTYPFLTEHLLIFNQDIWSFMVITIIFWIFMIYSLQVLISENWGILVVCSLIFCLIACLWWVTNMVNIFISIFLYPTISLAAR